MLASIIAFSGIPGGLAIPTLSDCSGRKISIVICNLAVMVMLTGFISVGANIYALIAIAAIYGAFYSAIWPIYAAYAADLFYAKPLEW